VKHDGYDNNSKPRPLGRGCPTTWGLMRQVISSSFAWVFGAWVGASGRGFTSLHQMGRWGDTPPSPPPQEQNHQPRRGSN